MDLRIGGSSDVRVNSSVLRPEARYGGCAKGRAESVSGFSVQAPHGKTWGRRKKKTRGKDAGKGKKKTETEMRKRRAEL